MTDELERDEPQVGELWLLKPENKDNWFLLAPSNDYWVVRIESYDHNSDYAGGYDWLVKVLEKEVTGKNSRGFASRDELICPIATPRDE